MDESSVSSIPLPEFSLWDKMESKRIPLSFELELTARCNNNCRHCYINLPAGDKTAMEKELSFEEIKEIADEAVSLGVLWCLITGGEPLLRKDFSDIYLYLKRKGILVSVFTNATLITKDHVELFKKYPPREIEVTVYGVTKETYERVTQKPGSFSAFTKGLNLLLENRIRIRLKAMAMRSNFHELPKIAEFCRERTVDYFRFDPLLHLRFDGNPKKNEDIKSERLSAEEIVLLESSDSERLRAMKKACHDLINPEFLHNNSDHLFNCGAGVGSFTISYDGIFRLCSSLWHQDCVYDLKNGTITDAWKNFIPRIRDIRSSRIEYLEKCRICPIVNLCLWCPAHAYLETGEMDLPVDYFCSVAHARAEMLNK